MKEYWVNIYPGDGKYQYEMWHATRDKAIVSALDTILYRIHVIMK